VVVVVVMVVVYIQAIKTGGTEYKGISLLHWTW
jgi:hypothetical protein